MSISKLPALFVLGALCVLLVSSNSVNVQARVLSEDEGHAGLNDLELMNIVKGRSLLTNQKCEDNRDFCCGGFCKGNGCVATLGIGCIACNEKCGGNYDCCN